MGVWVGEDVVGARVGLVEGDSVTGALVIGLSEGATIGVSDGEWVGGFVTGLPNGAEVGRLVVGEAVGRLVGIFDGCGVVGKAVGAAVVGRGSLVGRTKGFMVNPKVPVALSAPCTKR